MTPWKPVKKRLWNTMMNNINQFLSRWAMSVLLKYLCCEYFCLLCLCYSVNYTTVWGHDFLLALWLPMKKMLFLTVKSVLALLFVRKLFFIKKIEFPKICISQTLDLFIFLFLWLPIPIFFLPLSIPFSWPFYFYHLLHFIFFLTSVKRLVFIYGPSLEM